MSVPAPPEPTVVNVRWWDGYLERFEATECRFGSDLLWMRLVTGQNRNIPLRHVRWFSTTPESHEVLGGPPMPDHRGYESGVA